MAIYKPSNCIPFSNAIDLTEKQDITCELNTSNTDVTGYKTRVLDSNNNVIFEGNDFTNLNDNTLIDYYNSGLNGSELTVPMVVTDPGKSNINNIYFSGYKWNHWRPNWKNIESGSTYFYGIQYFRVLSQTVGDIYNSVTVYEKVGNYFHNIDVRPSIEEAEAKGYFYEAGSSNTYCKILESGTPSVNSQYVLTEDDYNSLDEVYQDNSGTLFNPTKSQAIEDNTYYQPYVQVTRKNISEEAYEDVDNVYSVSQSVGSAERSQNKSYDEAVLGEYYYHDSYTAFQTKPAEKLCYHKYYYLAQNGEMVLCGNGSYDYNEISIIYEKIRNLDPVGQSQKPQSDYDWTDEKYYVKIWYNPCSVPPSYSDAIDEYQNYYYLDDGGIVQKINSDVFVDENAYTSYTNQGTVYSRNSGADCYVLYGSNVNSVSNYIEIRPCKEADITQIGSEYQDLVLFKDRYILVSNTDEEFYVNNIYEIYQITYSYTTETKPSYGNAIANKYYFRSDEYIPITEEAMQFSSYTRQYYIHDVGSYYVIDPDVTDWSVAYEKGYSYLDYQLMEDDKPSYVSEAIEKGLFYKDNNADPRNPYKKITSLINQFKYDTISVYKLNDLKEVTESISTPEPYFYGPVFNFYNGYKNQPYKWQITLKQGDIATQSTGYRDQKWYDMIITSGKVLGSTPNRIQGLLSEEIYRDYYIQLCNGIYDINDPSVTVSYVGNRTRIKSYDHSFGYLYPQEGEFTSENISNASFFQVYKYTNDPEYVSAARKVSYATTKNIDTANYGTNREILSNFAHESTYYTQVYNGSISLEEVTIDKYDENAGSSQAISVLDTSLLIKDQSPVNNGNALNGVYWLADVSYNTSTNRTTIKWQRTANADSWADFIDTAFFIENGGYSTQNFVSDAQAGNGTLDSTGITFYKEKPIAIYPEPNEIYKDEYPATTNFSGEDMRKYFSPVLKNSNTRTFIRPFVGVLDKMRFQYGDNLNNYVAINYVDSFDTERGGLWYINHDPLPSNLVLTPDTTDYTISTYFKQSDENPFYAYKTPYVDINILNATAEFDYFGSHIIGNRYLLSDATYKQEQNKTWKYFQWYLSNETSGIDVYNGDPQYSGSFRNKFVGVENGNNYKISILFEDELGFITTKTENVWVDINIEKGIIYNITKNLNCDLQAAEFSFLRNGIVNPSDTEGLSYSNSSMTIADLGINRKYGVEYTEVDIDNSGDIQNIPNPINNNFTLNSKHILSQYFQGKILDIDIETEFGENYNLSIDSMFDTEKSGNEIVENPNRSSMMCTFTTSSNTYSYYVNFIKTNLNYNTSSTFRDVQLVCFSLGKNASNANSSCDYLYTTIAHDISGNVVDNFYNLAKSNYNEMLPESETMDGVKNGDYKYFYKYNCDNPDYNSCTTIMSPLSSNSTTEGQDTTFGVWYDEEMVANEQADGTYVLVTNREITNWPTYESNLYWQDSDESYNFYEQVDINQRDEENGKNHSGRQWFANNELTFNIGVENYDPTQGTGEFNFNQNTIQCYIENINSEV